MGEPKSIIIPFSEDRISGEYLDRMVLAAENHHEQDEVVHELLNASGICLVSGGRGAVAIMTL
jgi:hypothetical protein